MTYANGRLPSTALATAQTGIQLAKDTATRYAALKAAAKSKLGRTISIAQPAGGYRSFAVQDAMHIAGSMKGTAAERERWGLNPNSTISIAAAGGSTHGLGTRVDIVGTPMDAAFLTLAAKYGFKREFGASDPNHFEDLGTWKIPVAAKVKAAVTTKKVYVTVTSKAPNSTLSGIAAAHSSSKARLTVARLLSLNPSITNPNLIRVGQKVRVA